MASKAKIKHLPRGELRGTAIEMMKSNRINQKSTDESKLAVAKKIVQKIGSSWPNLDDDGKLIRARSIMNFSLRNNLVGGKAVARKTTTKKASTNSRKPAVKKAPAKKKAVAATPTPSSNPAE